MDEKAKMENDQEKNNDAADEHEASELAAAQVRRREKKLADECHAYDLAMLAAEVCPGFQDPHQAIEKAWALLKEADFKLWQIDIEGRVEAALPQLEAESREQEKIRLAKLRLTYQKGVEIITGYSGKEHWGRALERFKKFLAAKAKKEGKTEAWVEAKLVTYRGQGFTGTEAKKLQEEFRQWREYRGQGRLIRKGDLRLKENKKKKLEKAQKEQTRQGRPRQSSENPFWDSTEARRTAAEKQSANPKGRS